MAISTSAAASIVRYDALCVCPVNTQLAKWETYNDIMAHVGVGVNMFIHRHNAKVTLEYRNRPIFDASGNVLNRKGNSFILQMQLFI